jgi:outer membrane protein OmpA-like peptidoglycan-associated protein
MKLVQFMSANPTVVIEISGHTDNVGVKSDNQKLSENRAGEVYKYLIEQAVSEDRMKFKGYGETVPLKSNDTNWGRAQNRRTEFEIIGLTE